MRKLLASFLFFGFASQALAWGRDGHRIVADLAQRQLRPAALAEARRLLAAEPDPSLMAVSNWVDQLRDTDPSLGDRTIRWHFIDFPRGDCSFVPARDCPDGQCVVAAINRNFLVLADRRRSDGERAVALKFLVHFVGDAHQPLHAAFRDDHGGNDFQISYRGQGGNLHMLWDVGIIESRGLEAGAYATLLSRQPALPFDATRRSDRPAVDWALESCRIVAGPDFYPASHRLDEAYVERNRVVVELRLRQAGARLADMLNFALAPTPTSPARP